jgi:hypothetical protein
VLPPKGFNLFLLALSLVFQSIDFLLELPLHLFSVEEVIQVFRSFCKLWIVTLNFLTSINSFSFQKLFEAVILSEYVIDAAVKCVHVFFNRIKLAFNCKLFTLNIRVVFLESRKLMLIRFEFQLK